MIVLLGQIIEFIFSVALCIYMKVGREETKMSGRVLKFAYRVEKNLLYNYEFGRFTKDLRFWLIPFFIPTLYRKILSIKSSYSFFQIMLILIDVLSLTDFINTTESYQRYCLVYCIRLFRTMVMLFDLVQEITKLVVLHYEQKHQQQQQQIQQQQQQIQQQQIKQPECNIEDSDSDEQLKLLNNKKQQRQQQTQIKRIIFPQMKIPFICLNLNINQQQYNVQVIDPWSFDESFSQVYIREQLFNMIKLNYCCQIYWTLKNTKCNPLALQKYRELIADYLSLTIWMN